MENIRKISIFERIKYYIIKFKYNTKIKISGKIKILGKLPVFKIPGNSYIKLGNKVTLNSDFKNTNTALSYPCKLICGIEGVIIIGDNTILNGVSITSYRKVVIGSNCQIASNTFISDTDFHPINYLEREKEVLGYRIDYNSVNKEEINIGNNVWIGWGCIILKGVTIGDNSIIAAGSVVVRDIPSFTLAAGNPATSKKKLN